MADNTDFNDAGSGIAVGVNGAAPQKHDDIIEDALTKQAKDVGAVFEAEVLAAFRVMRERRPADWQRYRKRIKDAGGSVGELDKLTGTNGAGDEVIAQGRPFTIEEPEPWPERVDGAELLNTLAKTFKRFVVLPEHGDTNAALWTLHTYAFECGHITPILVVESPQKGCGKTTLRDVLAALVHAPLSTDGISSAALFRVIEKAKPTVLMDDFDSWGKDNDELRGVLNTGYRRGGVYIRLVGDDLEPRGFSTFAPKCINLIGRLHPTLHDRAITLRLQRKLKDQLITSLHRFSGADLQRQCARWVADHRARIESANPDLPQALFNRTADNWRPLVTLADLAGGHWAERVRAAIVAALASNDEDEAAGVMLLADVRAMFKDTGATKMSSSALVESLHGLKERP